MSKINNCVITLVLLFGFTAYSYGGSHLIQFPDFQVAQSKISGTAYEFKGTILPMAGADDKTMFSMTFDNADLPAIPFRGRTRKIPKALIHGVPVEVFNIIKDLNEKNILKRKKFIVKCSGDEMSAMKLSFNFIAIKDISDPPADFTQYGITDTNANLKIGYSSGANLISADFTLGDFILALSKHPNNKYKMLNDNELFIETNLGKANIYFEKHGEEFLLIKKVDETGHFNTVMEGFDAGAYVISIYTNASK